MAVDYTPNFLTTLTPLPVWMLDAACAEHDPEIFFVNATTEALRVCDRCLVRDECLTYALDQRIEHGVWGGTSGSQRVAMRLRAKHRNP